MATTSESRRRIGVKGPWIAGLGVLAIYLTVFAAIPRGVFYSPDAGGKYYLMLGYRWDHGLHFDITYPARTWDPECRFYARHVNASSRLSMYAYEDDQGIHSGWTPWFPLLSRPFHAAFGVLGLHIIPFIGGLVAIGLAARLAERLRAGSGLATALVVALATPVLFYSMCFWEHTLATTLQIGALILLLAPPRGLLGFTTRRSRWMIAALLLATVFLLRRESILFPASLLLACGALHPRRRVFGSAALVLLLMGLAFGRLVLPALETACFRGLFPSADFIAIQRMLTFFPSFLAHHDLDSFLRMFLVDEYATLLPHPAVWAWITGLAACGVSAFVRGPWRVRILLAGAALVSVPAALLIATDTRYRTLNSVLLPAPFGLLAFLPIPDDAIMRTPRRALGGAVLITAFLSFLLLPVAGFVHGGIQWGSRYLMIVIILSSILASVSAIETCADPRASVLLRRATAVIAVWLIVLGALSGARGLNELRETRRNLLSTQAILEKIGEPVVTDTWWFSASFAPFATTHELYTVSRAHPMREWLNTIGPCRTNFVYVGFPEQSGNWETNAVPGLTLQRVDQRDNDGLRITRYRLLKP